MKRHCYFNGKITTLDKIKIDPYDIGVLRGYGVFDVSCALGEKVFLFKEHYARLKNSARELRMKLPWSEKEFGEILTKLLKLNGFNRSTIRTILTGGISSDAFSFCGKPTCYILIEKFQYLPKDIYEKGAKLMTHEFERTIPRAKVANYIEAVRNQDRKKKSKALEILFVKDGKVLEASTSNVFMVKNGKVITPKDNILLGTTRNLIVKLAKKKYPVEEREISFSEFKKADEVFLTATNKFVVPIVQVDSWKVGNGKIGQITKNMMQIFAEFEKRY
ncbi:MAG: aminotransferase class IV [Patescibacteria group bacterium]